jgi:dinuclear metal center YbgI/SA1388 family protein
MKLADILVTLGELAPLRYAESWDNVGLLVGDPASDVRRVLVAVDYSRAVAAEAKERAVELVVAYHPPLFAPVKRIPFEAPWAQAIVHGIALYSPHTALDVAPFGTNDFLADACGIDSEARSPLRAFESRGDVHEPAGIGLGRVGDVAPVPLSELVERIKTALSVDRVLVAGALDSVVRRVAVAAGSGAELIGDASRLSADVLVTGEIRHHDALAALSRGLSVVATLHSNSERAAVKAFAARLAERLDDVVVLSSERDADPFRIV